MRIAVLASSDGWHVQELARAAGRLGHDLATVSFRRLQGFLASPSPAVVAESRGSVLERVAVALSQVDCVIVRTMPAGSLEQVIFRMDALRHIEAAGVPVINPATALEAAVDKYLASCRMESAGLPLPPTAVCENADDALEALERLGGDVVLKPIFGSEGNGITRVDNPDLAYRVFKTVERLGGVLYLQKFIDHGGSDLRLFVLGDRVLAAMRRTHPDDWRTNLARGARGAPAEPTPRELELALAAARSLGATIAGVDLVRDPTGELYVLEVNAVPGWRGLAKVSGIDVATELVHHVAQWL